MKDRLLPFLLHQKMRFYLYVPYVFLFLFALAMVLPANIAEATTPKILYYQGKISKASDGTNIANGNYSMQFKIYDTLGSGSPPTGGTLLWTETWDGGTSQVAFTNGMFSAALGTYTSLSTINLTGGSLYLTVNFNPGAGYDGEMAPRQQLTAAAFAIQANGVNGDGTVQNTVASATALTVANAGVNFALQVDTNTVSSVTGLKITSATIGGGIALAAISSGTDEGLTLNAKGAGALTIGGVSTGVITIGNGASSAIKLGKFTTANGVLFVSATDGTVTETAASTAAQCLQTASAGSAPIWGSCGTGGGSTAFDTIGDPTGSGAVAMANFAQTLDWSTLTTQTGLAITGGTAMTTGTLFKVNSSTFVHATTETGQLAALDFTDASSNGSGIAITNGLDVDVTINTTGAGGKQINALNISTPTLTGCATGTCTFAGLRFTGGTGTLANLTSYGLYIDAGSGSGTEYAAAFMNGNVGIGTDAPASMLQIGAAINRGDIIVYGDIKAIGSDIQRSLAGIVDIFVYDTTLDADGGEWRDSILSQQMSWATETKDNGPGDACVIATDDRCGTSTFPRKAIIASTIDALYIFDASDNSLWMKFTQAGTYSLGASTNNNLTGVGAQNGVIVVGTKGTSATGMYAFDFKQDEMYRYNTTNRSQADINIGNRNSTATYADNAETGFAIVDNAVNDVSIAMQTSSNEGAAGTLIAPIDSQAGPHRGVTIIAAATDTGVSVINTGTRKVISYSNVTGDDYNQVVMTSRGRMYTTNETQAELEEWRGVDTVSVSQLNGTPTRIYDETTTQSPLTTGTAPTISTSPGSLAVIERSSSAREASAAGQIDSGDVVFVGTNQGLAEIHTSGGLLVAASWSKLTTTTVATPYMVSTARSAYLFDEAAGSTTAASSIGSGATNNTMDSAGATAPTFGGSGVRGNSVNFNNNSYLCSDANVDGTCDADTDYNASTTSFTVSLWFKHGVTAAADTLFERCYTPATPAVAVGCIYAGMTATGTIRIGLDSITTWTYATTYDDTVVSTATYNDNQWHHLIYTNTDTDICLYIDGRQAAACDVALAATATLDAAQVLTIGGSCSGANCTTGVNFWDGSIDDFVWSSNAGTTAAGITAQSANKLFLDGRAHMIRPSTTVTDATTVSATTIGDSGESYTPGSFVGLVVELTGGTGSGQTRSIVSNTATTFTVYPAFNVTPDTTTDYRVSPAKLYGSTNNVTAIGVDAPTQINKIRKVYIGTDDGADGGGVSVFTNAGTGSIKTDVIHSDAGYSNDDLGSSWSGTGADNITALGSYSETLAMGTDAFLRVQRKDTSLKQVQGETISALEDLRQTIVAAGLFGSTQDVLGLGQGADLAEYYYSTETLDYGDVVVIDKTGSGDDVIKSSQKYSGGLIGVVSTKPGIVLGNKIDTGFPIALTGRVPVKFSDENGPVKAGDYLTSSSIPGFAMRATGAGPIIGKALTDSPASYDMGYCPSNDLLEITTGPKCANVLIFVEHGNYSGMSIDELMKEMQVSVADNGAIVEGSDAGLGESITIEDSGLAGQSSEDILTNDEKILAFLNHIKQIKQQDGLGVSAEIFTDRVSAAFEIITPLVTVSGLKVERIGKLGGSLDMLSDVTFFGRPYFHTDTAGFALIKAGEQTVEIKFDREYLDQPIVSATVTLDKAADDADQLVIDKLNQLEEQILSGDLRYIVTKKSVKGFVIKLAHPAIANMQFSWTAFAVKQPKIFSSDSESGVTGNVLGDNISHSSNTDLGNFPYEIIVPSDDSQQTNEPPQAPPVSDSSVSSSKPENVPIPEESSAIGSVPDTSTGVVN